MSTASKNNPPKPAFYITQTTMQRGNRATTAPSWLTPKKKAEVPDGLFPDIIDSVSLPTPESVINNGQVPEIIPLFLGLRTRIAERRARKSDEKIDDLVRRNNLYRYVGIAIFKGSPQTGARFRRYDEDFSNPDWFSTPAGHSLRPLSLRDRATTRLLEESMKSKRLLQGALNKNADPYLVDVGARVNPKPGLPEPDFSRSGVPKSYGEKRHNYKNRLHNEKLGVKIDRREKLFNRIVNSPRQKLDNKITKRNGLILKAKALRREQDAARKAREDLVDEFLEGVEQVRDNAAFLASNAARYGRREKAIAKRTGKVLGSEILTSSSAAWDATKETADSKRKGLKTETGKDLPTVLGQKAVNLVAATKQQAKKLRKKN